ncbi:hypothetical protein BURPS305_1474 [Burkholderia pseudomallei 305]|nr:hypothetical protein BURPS305_1474 [Burkholderia pseudomallei 305]
METSSTARAARARRTCRVILSTRGEYCRDAALSSVVRSRHAPRHL